MELTEYLYQKRVVNGYKFKLDEKKAIMSLLTPFKIVPCDQGALHKKKKKKSYDITNLKTCTCRKLMNFSEKKLIA